MQPSRLSYTSLFYRFTLFSILFFSLGQAFAFDRRESVEIPYWSTETRGESTLHLRSDLNRSHPYFDPNSFQIERIILIAKSEMGRAEAQVSIGQYLSERRQIAGDPRDFYNRDPRSFYAVEFVNYGYQSAGPWMIHLRGHIMIEKVILIGTRDQYQPHPGPGYPGQPHPPYQIVYYNAGSERTQKIVETSKEFRARSFDESIDRIRIIGTKEKVRIIRAVIETHSGQQFELPEVRGVIRDGQEVGAFVNGAYLKRLIITSVSENLTGSRGEYKVDFGVRQRSF